jgi:thiol-disulfide isomerase/thioredoxin
VEPSVNLNGEDLGAEPPPGASADGALAALGDATAWLNSPPLAASDLRGRVVLVDFWTYTCINWLRSQPYLRCWAETYTRHRLVVIGVHTPEFDVERDVDNIVRASRDLRVDYPIAIDTDYAIWHAFGNQYWPALYLIDDQGRMRHHRFGEGDYERSERVIRSLLTEAGAPGIGTGVGTVTGAVEGRGVEAAADWEHLRSPETYLGYERTENFVSLGDAGPDARHVYAVPERLRLNHWGLSGDWTVRRQAAVLNQAQGRIAYRFHARDLHLVLAPVVRGESVRFRVTLDGRPPGDAHGIDVDERGAGAVSAPRLYQLVRQPGRVSERTFEITFLDPGVRAFVVTFG